MCHPKSQYEFFCKHLEYLDSNVFKGLGIFFAFSGVALAKIDLFNKAYGVGQLLILIVGTAFYAMLYRNSELITEFKYRINELDKIINPSCENSISNLYLNAKYRRTSDIGKASIIIITTLMVGYLTLVQAGFI